MSCTVAANYIHTYIHTYFAIKLLLYVVCLTVSGMYHYSQAVDHTTADTYPDRTQIGPNALPCFDVCACYVPCELRGPEKTPRGLRNLVCCAREDFVQATAMFYAYFSVDLSFSILASRRCRESQPSPRRLQAIDVACLTSSEVHL